MNINLRPARPADAEEMARWFVNLTDLAQWGGPDVTYPLTPDQLSAWIAEGTDAKPRTCFAAVDASDTPTGHVQFLHDAAIRWVRIGRFSIAPAMRGTGFGRALFAQAVTIAFDEMAADEVELGVHTANERAWRLYLSAGFSKEGQVTGGWVVDGQPYAMHTMRLRRAEWLAQPARGAAAARVA